jgi:hypothetical protein
VEWVVAITMVDMIVDMIVDVATRTNDAKGGYAVPQPEG